MVTVITTGLLYTQLFLILTSCSDINTKTICSPLLTIIMCFLSDEILNLLSESQQEIETQQEIITSLSLQLRERDEENEKLKKILNGKYFSS